MIDNANLIWLKEKDINQYIDVHQTFAANKAEKVSISIFADTEYVVYINGKYVGSGQFKSYENTMVYDEYDITEVVHNGENNIDVIAYHQGESSFTYKNREAALAFEVYGENGEIFAVSGNDTKVRTNACYKSGEMELITPQIGYVFYYDANGKEKEWEEPQVKQKECPFKKRPVAKLSHLQLKQGVVQSQGVFKRTREEGTVGQIMQSDYLSFVRAEDMFDGNKVKVSDGGTYVVYALGEETAGLFSMSVTAKEGTVIDIGYGEHLDDLRVKTSLGNRNFACRYVCREGKQDFTGYFRRFAGRFIEIHISGTDTDVEIHNIGLIPTIYPLTRKSNFECEDYLFNKIYQASTHTLELCMHEHYEDCPWREQALYGFDSYIQMLCGYYAFGEYEFARASLKLLADSQLDCGLLEICAPAESSITIPSFSLAWILSLEKYVLYSGDAGFGIEMMPVAKRILDSFRVDEGLVRLQTGERFWHFYEWTDNLDGIDKKTGNFASVPEGQTDSVANMYYIIACEAYNRLSEWCGEKSYDADLQRIRKNVRECFADKESGFIKTHADSESYDEFTQALALFSGITDDSKIFDELLNKDSNLVKYTLSTSLFKYEVLLSCGGKYTDRVIDEIADIWGKMLFAGADTFWETALGSIDFTRCGSTCHGWSALPVYLIYKYFAGFVPLTPGFEKYKLEPVKVKNIGEIKADLFTPQGKIQ